MFPKWWALLAWLTPSLTKGLYVIIVVPIMAVVVTWQFLSLPWGIFIIAAGFGVIEIALLVRCTYGYYYHKWRGNMCHARMYRKEIIIWWAELVLTIMFGIILSLTLFNSVAY